MLERMQVLVWDNSPQDNILEDNVPESLAEPSLPFAFTYHHAERNVGVAGAYNSAMQMARERSCTWLLLLDHDTSVTVEFLRGMARYADEDADEEGVQDAAESSPQAGTVGQGIAAVLPFLYAGERVLSPRLWRFGRHEPLPRPAQTYIEDRAIFAANSGTLLRVASLAAIGGYSLRFWLDYSDIYVFHRLHAAGYRVRIAADLALQHEIAMQNYDRRMTPQRYAIYLAAEGDFLDLYRGPLERALHLLRLAARAVRQRRYASPAFSQMSRAALWQRLRTPRGRRLAARS